MNKTEREEIISTIKERIEYYKDLIIKYKESNSYILLKNVGDLVVKVQELTDLLTIL